MDLEQIIATLREHEPELRAEGVLALSLFGSVARGYTAIHDVDIAVRLKDTFSRGGLDYFGRMEELEDHLSGILDCKVDVVEEPAQRERFQNQIDQDRAVAF